MAKKDFKGGLNSLLGENKDSQDIKAPPPEKQKRKEITKTTQEGTYEGEIRATFIVKEDRLETLKALAYWERKKIKDLLEEAIDTLIKTKSPDLLQQAITEFKNSKNKNI